MKRNWERREFEKRKPLEKPKIITIGKTHYRLWIDQAQRLVGGQWLRVPENIFNELKYRRG